MSLTIKKEIGLFTTVVIGLSIIISFISYKLDNNNLSFLIVFTPTITAFILTLLYRGKKDVYDLFVIQTIQKFNPKWLIISVFGIPLIAFISIVTTLNFDVSLVGLRTTQLIPQFVVIILIALGEEYGWRAYLLPRLLNKFNFFYSSLILGFVWGFWHFPGYLIKTGVPLEMSFFLFFLWVILATLFINWIYLNTKSVLTSIIIHISANIAFNYLLLLPEFTGSSIEFLVFVIYLLIFILFVLFINRNNFFIQYK